MTDWRFENDDADLGVADDNYWAHLVDLYLTSPKAG